jgi:uncharacterized protein with ParB-like and HNH nuclease domain
VRVFNTAFHIHSILIQSIKWGIDENYEFEEFEQRVYSEDLVVHKNILIQNKEPYKEIDIFPNEIKNIIYSKQKYKMLIPPYQRDYVWSEENINLLIHDIEARSEDDHEHYFGILSFKLIDGNIIKVIDGQQRMTTVSLIIKAIHLMMCSLNKEDFNEINNSVELKNFLKTNPLNYFSNSENKKISEEIFKTNSLDNLNKELTSKQKENKLYINFLLFMNHFNNKSKTYIENFYNAVIKLKIGIV